MLEYRKKGSTTNPLIPRRTERLLRFLYLDLSFFEPWFIRAKKKKALGMKKLRLVRPKAPTGPSISYIDTIEMAM